MSEKNTTEFGILGEFKNPGEIYHAAEKLRDAGFKDFDCYTPFPIHGMDAAMGLKRSRLAQIIAVVAFFATLAGLALQWYANAVDYPIVISGKPFISYQAYAPVGFAIAILISGISTVVIMLVMNGLPRWNHPLFNSQNFKRVTDDGFFMSIESSDAKYDLEKTKKLLAELGASNIEVIQNDA